MRKITHLSKTAIKLLPACVLAVMAMPAHSAPTDQLGGVRNGLLFEINTSLNPEINNFSSKTTYLMADPTYYDRYDRGQLVSSGTMAQVFADQDRKDADERNRIYGTESAYTQFVASQALNKDWRADVGLYVEYNQNAHTNYGSGWGVGLDYKTKARFNIGLTGPAIGISRTDADPVIRLPRNGKAYFRASYMGTPNLTLSAAHALTSSGDDRINSDMNWRKHSAVSASYLVNVSPYHQVTLGLAGSRARGSDTPFEFNQHSKNDGYMGSIAYRYRDVTLGFDYGKGKEKFNGVYLGELDKTSYGVKATYRFTPRFQGSLSYGVYETENSKSLSFQDFTKFELGLNEQNYFFAKSKTERYRLNVNYSIRNNLSLFGAVISSRTKHHVLDERDNAVKPFAKNESLLTAAGVSFSF